MWKECYAILRVKCNSRKACKRISGESLLYLYIMWKECYAILCNYQGKNAILGKFRGRFVILTHTPCGRNVEKITGILCHSVNYQGKNEILGKQLH